MTTTEHQHRRRCPVAIAAVALLAILGTACGGGDDGGGAAATTAAPATDATTATAAPKTTTTTAGAPSTGSDPSCTSVSEQDVEGVVGEPVTEAPELAASVVSADVRAVTDDLCLFSSAAAPGALAVLVQRSDDPRAWDYIKMMLESNGGAQPLTPVDGLGDQGLANVYGAVGYLEGQTGTLVYVRLGSADETVERALALAHLVAG